MAVARSPERLALQESQRGNIHPTQKPVALFEYLIRTYTNPGELVLDNCMGSSTMAITCINTDRRYVDFELDSEYFAKATNRIGRHSFPSPLMIPPSQEAASLDPLFEQPHFL
jgi:site-specific DNA-methyltransferase (adenine-specific)